MLKSIFIEGEHLVKLLISFIAMVLLFGCSSKGEKELMEAYSQDVSYHKQLQKTEKLQLYQDQETKVMLTATYLYIRNFDKNDTRDEEFIIAVHENEKAFGNINSRDYNLTLNGQVPKEIHALGQNDQRLKDLSFVTNWADYYLVTFPHVSDKNITLVYENKVYGKGTMHFAKVAKYVLEE
jgi:hypothetical protein